MNKTDIFLTEHNASVDHAAYAREFADLAAAWDACERVDWLLWSYAAKVERPDVIAIRFFMYGCVGQMWSFLNKEWGDKKAVAVQGAFVNWGSGEGDLSTAQIASMAVESIADDAAARTYATHAAYSDMPDNSENCKNSSYSKKVATTAAINAYIYARHEARKAQAIQFKKMVANPFL